MAKNEVPQGYHLVEIPAENAYPPYPERSYEQAKAKDEEE